MPGTQNRLLICFDGSPGSVHAVEEAARLFPGAHATLVHAWLAPLPYGGIGYGGQILLPPEIHHELEETAERHATEVAERGVALAKSAGLDATADVREAGGPSWRALLGAADDSDADVVVAGSRGFGEFKALMLGSTSTALSHHLRRPLLIVPTPQEE